jgi:hypothetical protein
MHRYKCYNAAMATTTAQGTVATGTTVKTMLQISTPSTRQLTVFSWGYSIDAPQNGFVELIQTDVAATVTAHVAAGVQPIDPNAPASLVTLGTANTGYTASAEGSITATRQFDVRQPDAAAGATELNYAYQFTQMEAPIIAVSKFLRVRATFGTTVNMICWICWDE